VPSNPIIEHDIQNEIRIWCGEHDMLAIRINVGLFKTFYGDRIVDAGPPKGFPDLLVILNKGRVVFCECKAKYGRLRDDQKKFHAELQRRGHKVIVPKSLEEFIKEMEEYGRN
jgi:hypothetical protein